MFNTLAEVISSRADSIRGVTFVTGEYEEKFVTYKEVYGKSLEILFQLQSKGIKPGDQLIVYTNDNESLIRYFWACVLGRIIPVPVAVGNNDENIFKLFNILDVLDSPYLVTDFKIYKMLKDFLDKKSLNYILENIQGRIIYDTDMCNTGEKGIINQPSPDDIAFIQFSSGSTGNPRGVTLTHKNLITNINAMIEGANLVSDDVFLSWMPLTHDLGFIGFHLTPTCLDINQYIMPTSLFIRHPILWLKKAIEHKVTILASPNFGYKYFLKFYKPEKCIEWDLSCIRLIVNGAEPISYKLCKEFLSEMGKYGLSSNTMFAVYGMAEACLAVTFPPIYEELKCVYIDRRFLVVGQPVKYITSDDDNAAEFVDLGYTVKDVYLKICDENGKELDENTVGHIFIKGENVTKRYYNNPEATKDTITGDGWLNTGDLGLIRNGRLLVTGRAKDVHFVNGQNFYLHDIERVTEEVEGVELGEVAAACVYNTGLQKDEVFIFVLHKKDLEEFVDLAISIKKYINKQMGLEVKHVIPVRKIPKTTSGKIQRYKLSYRYENGEYTSTVAMLDSIISDKMQKMNYECINETQQELMKICKEVLGINNIGVNDNFFEIGFNSLLLSQVVNSLEQIYPGSVQETDLFTYTTITKLAEYIDSKENMTFRFVNLPQEYFNQDSIQSGENKIFKAQIDEHLVKKLRKIASCESVDIEEIFIAAFIFMFSRISNESSIEIQTLTGNKDTVVPINLDVGGISDFSSLIRLIKGKREQKEDKKGYLIQNIKKAFIKKDIGNIFPLILNKDAVPKGMELIRYYDIVLILNEIDNSIMLEFECNCRRLKDEKAKVLVNSYINLIRLIIEKYELDDGGVAI